MTEGYRTDTKTQADYSLWKEDSGNKSFGVLCNSVVMQFTFCAVNFITNLL